MPRHGRFRRFVLAHRIRLEERFFDSGEKDFEWRLRYRLGTKISLNSYNVERRLVYLILAAELFADPRGGTSDFLPWTFYGIYCNGQHRCHLEQ